MYRAKEAYKALDSNRLLSVHLETNKSYNLAAAIFVSGVEKIRWK